MKIIISERQLKTLKEQKNDIESLSELLWGAVIGFGTDEDAFFQTLNKIKNQNTLKSVSDYLSKNHNQDFYSIINEFLEFTDDEKQTIVKILNSNNLPHYIEDDEIVPKKIIDYKELIQTSIDFRREIVAATLVFEAGGESAPNAMEAVLSVLQNRIKHDRYKKFGKYKAQQALVPQQFSCWNPVPRTYEGIKSFINEQKKHPKWTRAYELASKSSINDVTNGATHYYASSGDNKLSKKQKERHNWTLGLADPIKIGNHTFGTSP